MQVLDRIDGDAIARLRAADEYFWLDLVDPDAATLEELAAMFGLSELVVEDLQNRQQRPKLDDYAQYVHAVFYGVDAGLVEVHLIIHGDAVITARPASCAPLASARERARSTDPSSEEYAVYLLLDSLTDSYFPLLEHLADEIDDLEDEVVGVQGRRMSPERLIALRRKLSGLRRVVGPQRDMLAGAGDFMERVPGLHADEVHDYYRDVYDHLLRIGDLIDSLRESLASIRDLQITAQANRLNEIVYRLTIVGTIFLPMTFLTGFFGQNFGWLVDHVGSAGAFWGLGIGLEVAAIGALLLWFRRTGINDD